MRKVRIVLLLVAIVVGVVSNLGALPGSSVYIEYYDDNTFTNLVGWRLTDCVGGRTAWGVRTDYYYVDSEACNGSWHNCQYCIVNACVNEACQ